MKTILFLCTANYFRSRFAEELFNYRADYAGIGWQAQSRALAVERLVSATSRMSRFAVSGLQERGCVARAVNRLPLQCLQADLETANHIVAINESEHRPLMVERFPHWVERVEYWNVSDVDIQPWNMALAAIDQHIDGLLQHLRRGRLPVTLTT